MERTAGGLVDGAGHLALEHLALFGVVDVRHRDGRQKGLGVGVKRLVVQSAAVCNLYDFSQIHHDDAVGHVLHHAQVMGNEQIGQIQFFLDVLHQVQHLGLNGHVQSGHRLVTDQHLRHDLQGAGDTKPLPLSAGELVGIAHQVVGLDVDHLQHLTHPLLPFLLALHAVDLQRLFKGRIDLLLGVQGGVGVLEHHLDLPPEVEHLLAVELGDVLELAAVVEQHAAAGGPLQHHHSLAQGGLAAAGLAHDAQRLALVHVQAHAVDGLHVADGLFEHALGDGEPGLQILDLENHFLLFAHITAPPGTL